MNKKQLLLGIVLLGILAATVKADWDTPRETVQAYAPTGKAVIPWFIPSERGETYLSQSDIGVHLDQKGIWGAMEGTGSPQLIQSFWSSNAVIQYRFQNARILATGPISAFAPGMLAWARPDYTIPGVYELDGTTPAELDKNIINAVIQKNPKITDWGTDAIRHDVCYGTGHLSIEQLGTDGAWTLYDKSDFCSEAREKEMAQYR